MESRIHLLLLRTAVLSLLLAVTAGCGVLGRSTEPLEDASASSPVIDPRIERREVAPPKIDSEDFEVTGYYGMISVEDFGTNSVVGARLAYHVTEGLFAEATYAQTSDVDKSSAEILGNYDLSFGSDRKYKYYDLSLGYNLLPGEVFIGRNRAFNSAFYVIAGAGNTTFHDEDMFTLSFGGGYRILLTDAIGLHFDVRDHMFDDDISGEDKTTHNIEFTLGLSWFFSMNMRRNLVRLVLVACLSGALLPVPLGAGEATGDVSGPAADFSLPSRGGAPVSLSGLRGQVVLINFWATWCGPCRKEMPLLEQIQKKYAPLGFTMLGVNVEEDTTQMEAFLGDVPVSFPVLLDPANRVSKLYDVAAMPSTVIVDRKGNIRYIHQGYQPGDESRYQDVIRQLIRERT